MHHFSASSSTLSPNALDAPSSCVSSAAGVNPDNDKLKSALRKNQQNLKGKTTYFADSVKYVVYYDWRYHENV